MSLFTAFFFIGGFMGWPLKTLMIIGYYIWIRATLPRLRYDNLIQTAWKKVLPITLGLLGYTFLMGEFL
jgi:NADH:ubiquinone oxidoreductase subunit H